MFFLRHWKFLLAALFVGAVGALSFGFLTSPTSQTIHLSSESSDFNHAVLEQIQNQEVVFALQKLNTSLNPALNLNQSCATCGLYAESERPQPRFEDPRYEVCTARNNYLDGQLSALSTRGDFLGQLSQSNLLGKESIRKECFTGHMKSVFLNQQKSFGACGPGVTRASQNQYRPCISEKYVRTVKNSFDVISQCLKGIYISESDILATYALMTVESGLHMNALSPTGAGGVGQFVQDGIRDINTNEISNVKIQLAQSKELVCRKLGQEVLSKNPPMKDSPRSSCDRISISNGNPALNMIYTFAYVHMNKMRLKKDLLQNSLFKNNFNLSPREEDQLMTALASWAHNTGMAGLMYPIQKLLYIKYQNTPVTDIELFLTELSSYMKVASHPANRRRTTETSRYYPSIQRIQEQAGQQCLIQ